MYNNAFRKVHKTWANILTGKSTNAQINYVQTRIRGKVRKIYTRETTVKLQEEEVRK